MKSTAMIVKFVALLAAALAVGPVPAADAADVLVSAAASLKPAFEEIGRSFAAANPDTRAFFNFGGSGELAAQIEAGAPVDVVVLASAKDMDRLERAARLAPASRQVLVANRLVLVVPASSFLKIGSFPDLAQPAVKRIAIGNPRSVPAGRYAEDALRSFGLLDAVRDRLVPGESILQVLGWCTRGEVDAGLVYATDAQAHHAEIRVAAEAPAASHAPILYPAALVRDAPHGPVASAFLAYLLSPAGRGALAKHGFLPPPGP